MSWGCGGAGTPSNQQEAVEWESYCAPLLDHDDDVGGWWLNVCSLGCSGDALASIQSSRRRRINGQRPTGWNVVRCSVVKWRMLDAFFVG